MTIDSPSPSESPAPVLKRFRVKYKYEIECELFVEAEDALDAEIKVEDLEDDDKYQAGEIPRPIDIYGIKATEAPLKTPRAHKHHNEL
jgi:hypothetical protein